MLSGEFLANDGCWGRGVNFLQVLGHQESTHAPVGGLIPVYIQEAVKSEAQFFLFIYFFYRASEIGKESGRIWEERKEG